MHRRHRAKRDDMELELGRDLQRGLFRDWRWGTMREGEAFWGKGEGRNVEDVDER